jgi:hypothetical protein
MTTINMKCLNCGVTIQVPEEIVRKCPVRLVPACTIACHQKIMEQFGTKEYCGTLVGDCQNPQVQSK